MGRVYKENKNLINKFKKCLEKDIVIRNNLKISREITPSDKEIEMFSFYINYHLDNFEVKLVEDTKRVYFCASFNEREADRNISVSESDSNLSIEDTAVSIIYNKLKSYWLSSAEEKLVFKFRDHLLSKGVVYTHKGNDLTSTDVNTLSSLLRYEDFKQHLNDFPEYIKLVDFMKRLKSADVDVFRFNKVFPKVKDMSVIPLGYYDAETYTINIPDRRDTSSNKASLAFYGKFAVRDNFRMDGLSKNSDYRIGESLEYLAELSVRYTPISYWVCIVPKINDYNKDRFNRLYMS